MPIKLTSEARVLLPVVRKMLAKNALSPASIADAVGVSVTEVVKILKQLEVAYHGELVTLAKPSAGKIPLKVFGDKWQTYGLVADTHLCSRFAREDALAAVYDIFEQEGITKVFHAGNMVDGYIPRINGDSVYCSSIDDQTQYVIDHYPKKKNISTLYVTGADHEGWWGKEGFGWGNHLQMIANQQGREDLIYMGHVEADVEFKNRGGSAIMKVQHPGGGSAYSRSYTGQKLVESLEGGEKPAILVQGHYHVSNFMQERNVYVISMPGLEDQTIFGRQKRLRMEVGAAILRFKQNPFDGTIARLSLEFIRFFDRGYYKTWIDSDDRVDRTVSIKTGG